MGRRDPSEATIVSSLGSRLLISPQNVTTTAQLRRLCVYLIKVFADHKKHSVFDCGSHGQLHSLYGRVTWFNLGVWPQGTLLTV